jgi:hypothetical protein
LWRPVEFKIPPGEERATMDVSTRGRRAHGTQHSAGRSKKDNGRSSHHAQETLPRAKFGVLLIRLKELIRDYFPRWKDADLREVRMSQRNGTDMTLTVELGGHCSCWCPKHKADHEDGSHVYFRLSSSSQKFSLRCNRDCFQKWDKPFQNENARKLDLFTIDQFRGYCRFPVVASMRRFLEQKELRPLTELERLDKQIEVHRGRLQAEAPLPGSLCMFPFRFASFLVS